MAGTTHFDLIIGAEITPIEDGHEVSLCALALVPSSACSGGAMAPGLSGADSQTRTCAHVGAGRKPLRAALRGRRKGGHSGRDAAKWEVRIMPSFMLESTDRSLGACMLPTDNTCCLSKIGLSEHACSRSMHAAPAQHVLSVQELSIRTAIHPSPCRQERFWTMLREKGVHTREIAQIPQVTFSPCLCQPRSTLFLCAY